MKVRIAHILSAQALLAMAAATSAQVMHVPTYPFNGDNADDVLGTSVSGAGDVNNDGYDDFVAGAPGNGTNGPSSGMVRVYSGFDGSTLYTFYGDQAGNWLGRSVSGAGDVNNDGFDDIIAGGSLDDTKGTNSGMVRVYSGADGSVLYTFYGENEGDIFGSSVSGSGDVNNDGYGDFVIGAALNDDKGNESGSARVYSGFDGSIIYTFYGDSEEDRLGLAVSGAGDVNNDGFDDVIAGAFNDDDNGTDSGSVRVYSGLDGSVLYTFFGDSEGDWLGRSVSDAGDVNDDGFADIIAGAPHDDGNGIYSGIARVYSGADGSILYTFYGDSLNDILGSSVSGAGDVNNDGYDDLIVGATFDDLNGSNSGSARVYSGLDGSILYTFLGDNESDRLGGSVSGVGDINNDGFADFVAGAFADSNNGLGSGSVRVYRSVAIPGVKPTCPGDANVDGVVDLTDLNVILGNFGNTCD